MNQSSKKIRPYQEKAVSVAVNLLTHGHKKILLELAPGSGKTFIVTELVKRLLEKGFIQKVLILTSTRMAADLFTSTFNNLGPYKVANEFNINDHNRILVSTYYRFHIQASKSITQKFDLIICDEAQHTDNIDNFIQSSSMLIGIVSSGYLKKQNLGWFKGTHVSFRYSTSDMINDGYLDALSPEENAEMVKNFIVRLLEYHHFEVVKSPRERNGTKLLNPDLYASKDEQRIIFEIKAYRGRTISKSVLDTAIMQMLEYKSNLENKAVNKTKEKFEYCLILFCEVDNQTKKNIFERYSIMIWDIANLQYICGDNIEFSKELSELLYFPISGISPEKPYGWIQQRPVEQKQGTTADTKIVKSLVKELRACKAGKGAAASRYEDICTDILKFLFESEFTQMSNQHKTGDLFRMDLLCGIKGSSAFWDLLIRHYNTRFVVFEFKNYSGALPQNIIYTTEKYLFNAALRNVAIIVSRKGFSQSARIAALGCLKESGKLIIELTDKDLVCMLQKKMDGEEPSDYLLWNLEKLLMSVGK